jgi:hypothetical protein
VFRLVSAFEFAVQPTVLSVRHGVAMRFPMERLKIMVQRSVLVVELLVRRSVLTIKRPVKRAVFVMGRRD